MWLVQRMRPGLHAGRRARRWFGPLCRGCSAAAPRWPARPAPAASRPGARRSRAVAVGRALHMAGRWGPAVRHRRPGRCPPRSSLRAPARPQGRTGRNRRRCANGRQCRPGPAAIRSAGHVHLVHACIQHRHHLGAAMLVAGFFGHREQGVHRQHRHARAAARTKGQSLGHRAGRAQAGEGARAAAKNHGVQCGKRPARPRASRLRMAGISVAEACAPPGPVCCHTRVAALHGNGQGVGAGVKGKQVHGAGRVWVRRVIIRGTLLRAPGLPPGESAPAIDLADDVCSCGLPRSRCALVCLLVAAARLAVQSAAQVLAAPCRRGGGRPGARQAAARRPVGAGGRRAGRPGAARWRTARRCR